LGKRQEHSKEDSVAFVPELMVPSRSYNHHGIHEEMLVRSHDGLTVA